MAAHAILYFRNSEFLFAAGICGSQSHHCTKFRQNRGDIAIFLIFMAQGYAKRGICRRRVSVCLSLCVSVTLRYCIKTAKRRITQT